MPRKSAPRQPQHQTLKYCVRPGNNSALVARVLSSRPWWAPTDDAENANLFWQQWTPPVRYYQSFQRPTHVCNHMPGNFNLHSKLLLYRRFCQFVGRGCFRFIMPTYELFGADRRRFEAHFRALEAAKQ